MATNVHATEVVLVRVEVDRGIAPLVRALGTVPGLLTFSSCEGTPESLYNRTAHVGFAFRGDDEAQWQGLRCLAEFLHRTVPGLAWDLRIRAPGLFELHTDPALVERLAAVIEHGGLEVHGRTPKAPAPAPAPEAHVAAEAAGLVVVSPEWLGKAVYRAAKRRLDEERGIRSDSIALDIVEAVIDRLTATPDQEGAALRTLLQDAYTLLDTTFSEQGRTDYGALSAWFPRARAALGIALEGER